MAKRPTDTGPLPRRMVDDPAVTPPICGHLEDRGDQPYVCAKNPGHLGGHTMTRADGEIVRRLAERTTPAGGYFDVPESPTDVLAMQTPSRPEHLPAAAPPDPWECKVTKVDLGGRYLCDRHDPHPENSGHVWVHWSKAYPDEAPSDTLPAVPPGGVQAADPAQPTPDGTASEPSGETAPSPAGSGSGSGRPTSLERPGQVAAGFGTSSGDLPFQAAHLGVLIPADRPQDARALAEEAAHVGGLMRTLGQITADYHAQKRLASPGLLVGLRFQVEQLLAARGLVL